MLILIKSFRLVLKTVVKSVQLIFTPDFNITEKRDRARAF